MGGRDQNATMTTHDAAKESDLLSTALMGAAEGNHVHVAEDLVRQGANVDLQDSVSV